MERTARATLHAGDARNSALRSTAGCVEHAIRRAVRAFLAAYGLKAVLGVAVVLLRTRSVARAVRALVTWDSARFGAFIGGLVGVAAATRCALIRLRGRDDRWNAFFSGTRGS